MLKVKKKDSFEKAMGKNLSQPRLTHEPYDHEHVIKITQ
jgi:hypothetical protein